MSAYDKLVFELSSPGRVGFSLPESDVPGKPLQAVDRVRPSVYVECLSHIERFS